MFKLPTDTEYSKQPLLVQYCGLMGSRDDISVWIRPLYRVHLILKFGELAKGHL